MREVGSSNKYIVAYIVLGVSVVLLFIANLAYGAVSIPMGKVVEILFLPQSPYSSQYLAWSRIVMDFRLPQAVTALLCGASLASSGLLLQTLFRNPLAGPSILGISDGANLGVAIVMLYLGGSISLNGGTGSDSILSITGYAAVVFAALVGALSILGIIIYMSGRVKNNVMLLIVGIMIGYLASSVISMLNFYASADKVHSFVMWGMGNFSGVSMQKLPYFAIFSIVGLVGVVLLIKPLNALLLGENYAANLGVRIKPMRIAILLITGILTASATAFCGPVSFIGLAVPHIARFILGTSNHRQLVPVTILSGSAVALLCNMLTVFPGNSYVLPLNAVTPFIGAPVIIYVILSKKNVQYFN